MAAEQGQAARMIPAGWRRKEVYGNRAAAKLTLDRHVTSCSKCSFARGDVLQFCQFGYDATRALMRADAIVAEWRDRNNTPGGSDTPWT